MAGQRGSGYCGGAAPQVSPPLLSLITPSIWASAPLVPLRGVNVPLNERVKESSWH